jgi:NitT/TauT family transport system substrate-binding protein
MLKRPSWKRPIVLLACALLSASAVFAQDKSAKPEKSQIRVGIIPISNLVPLYVAQKLGYFREAGLTVETTNATGGPALTAALVGGSLDFVYTSYVSVFQAQSQGFSLMIVANQNSAQRTAPDATSLMVRSDDGINRAQDLAGKTIGVSALLNINHITAMNYLEKNGMATNAVKFVEVPFPNMGDMLVNKQIDGAFMVEPFTTLLTQRAKVKTLAYPFMEAAPGLDIAGFVATKKFVAENPITVQNFVAALTRANAYLNSDRDARIKYVAEYTKSKPELVEKLTLDRWTHKVNKKDLQLLSDLCHKYGVQKGAVNVNDVVYKTAE